MSSVKLNPEKISFALVNSLVDLRNETVPKFLRASPTYVEQFVNGDLRVKTIPAFEPAFMPNTGSFIIEPAMLNEVTWNVDVTQDLWQKGSNVAIARKKFYSPEGSQTARRLTWTSGVGNTQLLKREIDLDAGTVYQCSVYLRLNDGRFRGMSDFVRISGGVVGSPSVSLTQLDGTDKRWRVLSFSFQTQGTDPTIPEGASDYVAVTSVTNSTVVLNNLRQVQAQSLVGATLVFNDVAGKIYTVSQNTASNSNGQVTVTVSESTLLGDGVTSASLGRLMKGPKQHCSFELYAESTATLDFGGVQIQKGNFRSSISSQEAELKARATTVLEYPSSPVAGLSTFGVFVDLAHWTGDGNLLNLGPVKLWIKDGRLRVAVGSSTINLSDPLPSRCKIYVQAASDRAALLVYVNGVLLARIRHPYFVPTDSRMILTSEGVRIYNQIFFMDQALLDRADIAVGQPATREVQDLFHEFEIDPALILSHAPTVKLPQVTVPGRTKPRQTTITAINTSNVIMQRMTVADATGITSGTLLSIFREGTFVARSVVISKTNNELVMQTVQNMAVSDTVVVGEVMPGRAVIRFPFTPRDPQAIEAVDSTTKRVRVDSVLSFSKGRAIVQMATGQDIAEVMITELFPNTNELELNDTTDIQSEHIIAQPESETLIDPTNYLPVPIVPREQVSIVNWAQNAIELENDSDNPVSAAYLLKVFL